MSYTFLLEQGEESLAESFSDIPPSVLSRLNLTAGKSCCNASGMESCQNSQSGMTCELLMGILGEEKSMSSAEGFHVKTSALLEKGQGSKGREADCGTRCSGSFAVFDQDLYFWKIPPHLSEEDYQPFLETFPKQGIMQNGECFQESMWVLPLKENAFLLPGPTKSMARRGWGIGAKRRYSAVIEENARIFGYKPHPSLLEWSMGWVVTWTGLEPLEMDKFQSWLHSHGEFLMDDPVFL